MSRVRASLTLSRSSLSSNASCSSITEDAVRLIRMYSTSFWCLNDKTPMRPFTPLPGQQGVLGFNLSPYPFVHYHAQTLSENGIIPWVDVVMCPCQHDDDQENDQWQSGGADSEQSSRSTSGYTVTVMIHSPQSQTCNSWAQCLQSSGTWSRSQWLRLGTMIWQAISSKFIIPALRIPSPSDPHDTKCTCTICILSNYINQQPSRQHHHAGITSHIDDNNKLNVYSWCDHTRISVPSTAIQLALPLEEGMTTFLWQYRQDRIWYIPRPNVSDLTLDRIPPSQVYNIVDIFDSSKRWEYKLNSIITGIRETIKVYHCSLHYAHTSTFLSTEEN
jgi:hypothetical protein